MVEQTVLPNGEARPVIQCRRCRRTMLGPWRGNSKWGAHTRCTLNWTPNGFLCLTCTGKLKGWSEA